VIPYTSIIDQTGREFRKSLATLADAVLEHHSGYRESANLEAEAKLARASENWDAPVVLTTAVFRELVLEPPEPLSQAAQHREQRGRAR
jgi:CRISPR-associated endonuclease/helicase Cas3